MSNKTYSTFNFFKGIAEFFTPVLSNSHFQEKGVLTPEEFVAAGDLLVSKCATWSWAAGDPTKARSFLPENKQYLITRNVPCLKRAKSLEAATEDESEVEGDWLETHSKDEKLKNDQIDEIPDASKPSSSAVVDDDDDDIPDMDDFDDTNNIVANDDATVDSTPANNDLILRTRTYDLSITYDKYYQTPRVWLFGYDENGQPLQQQQIFEDIYADYSNKTVTIETHPHTNVSHASIHPCRHAEVMKKIIDRMAEDGNFVRVDLYLFLFLKFISAVIPTIEYDFTIQVDGVASSSGSK